MIDATSTQATSTMRSVVQHRYGPDPAEVLRVDEVPRPAIGPSEVLVRVAAASVDLGTWHLVTGTPAVLRLVGFGLRAPKAPNPGRAFAGTVAAVGADVAGFAVGDEVYGSGDGAFAELVAASPARLARKPANASFAAASAVPISGGTALQAVRRAQVQAGQHVLVVGASGGVGSFAVQLAKDLGAEVTGVASTAKLDLVRSLGADHVLDHTQGAVVADGVRYDAIIDIGGSTPVAQLRRSLTERGHLVLVGGESGGKLVGGFLGRAVGATLRSLVTRQTIGMLASTETAADYEDLRELIEQGRIAPAVECTYPLEEVAAAIAHVSEGRAHGKVVLTLG